MNFLHNSDGMLLVALIGMMVTGILIAVVGLVTTALASPKRD